MSGDNDYTVGYGKPPKSGQFKKGKSGNTKGRPKGARNFRTEVEDILRSKVTVTYAGKPKSVGTAMAALMRLKEKALKGDQRALERLLAYAQEVSDTANARLGEKRLSRLEEDILGRFDLFGGSKNHGGPTDE